MDLRASSSLVFRSKSRRQQDAVFFVFSTLKRIQPETTGSASRIKARPTISVWRAIFVSYRKSLLHNNYQRIKINANFVKTKKYFAMKRLLSIVIMCLGCSVFSAVAQTDSFKVGDATTDSITIAQIKAIYDRLENLVPRYKIYKTENTYNLIKLDTATGQTWQVQYRVPDTESMTVEIDASSLLWYSEPEIAGRFELYPTNNMYQFILIDTQTGRTWQIQWNTTPSKRFRERIY